MRELSSLTRDWTQVPCIPRQILNHWTTKEVPPVTILNLRETCHLFLPSAFPVLAFLYLPCSLWGYRDHPSVFRAWEPCTLLPPPPLRSLPRLQPPLSSHRAPNQTSRFLLSPLFQTHIVTCPLWSQLTLLFLIQTSPARSWGPFLNHPYLPASPFLISQASSFHFYHQNVDSLFSIIPFQVSWHSALRCVTA